MGTIVDKTTYLNTTKTKIKDGINRLGGELTNLSTFRSYETALNNIYDSLPKVTGTGSNVSLTPTLKGGLNILPLGNAEQDTYTGKNSFNIENRLVGTINQDGDLVIPASANKFYEISFEENTQYTISATVKNSNSTGNVRLSIVYTDNTESDNVLRNATETYGYRTFTSINNKTISYIKVNYGGGGSMIIKNGEIQIEKGSTATTYEPYVGGIPSPSPSFPQPIKVVTGDNQVLVQNKNLLPFTNQDFTINDVRFKCENGRLKINGTASGNVYNNNSNFKNNLNFTLPSGTYFLSRNVAVNTYIIDYNTGTTLVTNNGSFTLEAPTKVYFGLYFTTGTSFDNLVDTAQLEKGSTSSESIPHQEQSTTLHLGSLELCKIGDYQDVITGSKDNWKVVRNVRKLELAIANLDQYGRWIGKGLNNDLGSGKNGSLSLYTSYKSNINSGNLIWTINCNTVGNNDVLVFYNSGLTPEEWKAQYPNLIMILYYGILSQSAVTEETITDTTLINDLNNLQELLSYDGTTNITITSDSNNAQMLAQVSALKGE